MPANGTPRPPEKESQSTEARDETDVAALATLGIKVRDFAYESTLPPIAPFVRRQIQPGSDVALSLLNSQDPCRDALHPRRLKRTRRDGTEEVDIGFAMGVTQLAPVAGDSEDGEERASKRRREPKREGALRRLDDNVEAELRADVTVWALFGDSKSQRSQSQSQSLPYSQQYPRSSGSSQDTDTEELITTPLVTPNGSLKWLDGEGPRSRSPLFVQTKLS